MITIGIKKDMSAANRGKINSKDFMLMPVYPKVGNG